MGVENANFHPISAAFSAVSGRWSVNNSPPVPAEAVLCHNWQKWRRTQPQTHSELCQNEKLRYMDRWMDG